MQDLALKIAQAAAAKRQAKAEGTATVDLAGSARKAAVRKLMAAMKSGDEDAFEAAYSELSDIGGMERDGD